MIGTTVECWEKRINHVHLFRDKQGRTVEEMIIFTDSGWQWFQKYLRTGYCYKIILGEKKRVSETEYKTLCKTCKQVF